MSSLSMCLGNHGRCSLLSAYGASFSEGERLRVWMTGQSP